MKHKRLLWCMLSVFAFPLVPYLYYKFLTYIGFSEQAAGFSCIGATIVAMSIVAMYYADDGFD